MSLCGPHFPHTKPFIKIISCNFKTAPYTWTNWGSEPLILLIQNRAIKHFKNISRKIHSSHYFLYKHHISTIGNCSGANPSIIHTWTMRRSGAGVLDYPTASFASWRLPQSPDSRTLIVHVCSNLTWVQRRRKFNL